MSTEEVRADLTDDLGERLDEIRTEPRQNALAIVVAVILGLFLAFIHWFGLILGGAAVGFVSRSLPLAILGAIGFGVLVLAVFAISLGSAAVLVPGMAPIVYVTVGAAFGLPVLGALVRGIV